MDLKWGLTADTALTGFKDLPNTPTSMAVPWQFGDSLSIRLSPPIEWDGESNLVLEFALEDVTSKQMATKTAGCCRRAWKAGLGPPTATMARWTSPRLIAWKSTSRPRRDCLLRSPSSAGFMETQQSSRKTAPCSKASMLPGQRVVNVHLPWSNGRVYWDCGQDGGYDRIDQQAQTEDYEGRWNHWAFVKNADTGIMEMYLNGALFHSGTNKDNPIEGIVKMNLGASGNGNNRYNGRVDDFRVWSQALDGETIASWMNRQPTAWHPNYDDLLVDYRFDGANGTRGQNYNPKGEPGLHHGSTLRRTTPAREQAKGLGADFRPYIGFGRGEYLELVADGAILDLQPVAP